ncbi:synaptotagmin-like protein 4 [Lethenteron reissneri]|uniref:synaptotagmin-like protein 4 n=1 Tax=Lethenteron reissneri TaxID=7753 RepID=UPI002AB65242|nr:synaptotagmin-like protein 4 [Lethenteron reissneri]XP_061430801.1 synaptotagmin-like protein 4 [Lethenteron reissneri]XP_061430802.1 synaptotagmin-like protein 4 [Lethenteron reissneri]XP_061430803.1 synaptotagmin-like protein 4 [Lethenteron reissneri]XP_061430804.1 synaptotagmin-like protein 4 [Lethenteron reissneri]
MELELGFLSEAERKAILEVLKRDEELRQMDDTRLKRLQKDLRQLKRRGVKKSSRGRTCARCQRGLGLLMNSGEPCAACRHVVCNDCRVKAGGGNKAWKCTVCHKEALYKVETGEWFLEEKAKRFGGKVEPATDIIRVSMKRRPGSKRDVAPEPSKKIRDQVDSGTSPSKLTRIPEEPGFRDEEFSDSVSNASVDSRPECSRQASRASRTSGRTEPGRRAPPESGRPSPVPSYVSSARSDAGAGDETAARTGQPRGQPREAGGGRTTPAAAAGKAGTAGNAQRPRSRDSGAVSPAFSKRSGVSSHGVKLSKSANDEEEGEEGEEGEWRDDDDQRQNEGGDEVDEGGEEQRGEQEEEGEEGGEEVEGRRRVDKMFSKCSKKSMESGGWTSEIDLRSNAGGRGGASSSSSMGSRCVSVPAVNMRRGVDEEDEEEDIDGIVTSHRGSASGTMRSTVSMMSLMSTYSEVDFGAGVEVKGDVLLSLQYEYRTGTLNVNVRKCRSLAYGNAKKQSSNPYVKVYLLPDKSKQSKRKTTTQKNTVNPVYNETLKYTISQSQLSTRTLQLAVWHHDTFGRNAFLGETEINMDTWNLDNTDEQWLPLQRKSHAQAGGIPQYKGELTVSLKYVPAHLVPEEKPVAESRLKRTLRRKQASAQAAGGEIHVLVKEARNLCPLKPGGTVNSFVKASLLPVDPKGTRQKTAVAKQKVSPVWGETLVLRGVAPHELAQRALELTVWDKENIASKHFLGGVRLGMGTSGEYAGTPVDWMDSQGEEVAVWEDMCSNHEAGDHQAWAEACLLLRPDMAKH